MARILLWAIPILLGIVVFIAHGAAVEIEELNRARTLLFTGENDEAEAIFSRYRDSGWCGHLARAGLAVCRALKGESIDEEEAASGEIDVSPYTLSLLMAHELRAGEFERCLSLAELGEKCGEPTAPLYRAAALMELARIEDVGTACSQIPEKLRLTFLGRRLGEALALWRDGVVTIVRDRAGLPVGTLNGDGRFMFAPAIDAGLVPPEAVENLADCQTSSGLRLSTDLELSEIARRALEGYQGSVVLLDPGRGDVLAAVSEELMPSGIGTPALQQRLEPASIVKIITLTAALRAGIDADAEIARITCRGAIRYQGGILYCPYTAGKLRGLDHAMAISCNIAFAELGVKVGWDGLLGEYRRYGFDGQFGNPFTLGSILIDSGSERRLADLAIGLEAADITPIHAAMIAAALANGGVMPIPKLIAGADGSLGISPDFSPPDKGTRVMDKQWLPEILSALAAVARWGGTAARVAPYSFPVAMKTGTGGEQGRGYHVNYIGVGPLPNPVIAFSVRVTGLRTSPRARKAGFEVTRRLLQDLDKIAVERGWR